MSSGPAGDGKAGAIREAGGAFGKMEVAREEEFFYKKVCFFIVHLLWSLTNFNVNEICFFFVFI